jgi:hypothetical protein
MASQHGFPYLQEWVLNTAEGHKRYGSRTHRDQNDADEICNDRKLR